MVGRRGTCFLESLVFVEGCAEHLLKRFWKKSEDIPVTGV